MPKMNLTVKAIEALKPTSRQVDYFDDDVAGFCVRLTPTGRKSFCVLYRMGRHLRRLTIGVYPEKSLADARDDAREALRSARRNEDPAEKKKLDRAADTFGELAEMYLKKYAATKRSGRESRRIVKTYLSKLKHVRAKNLTRAQVRMILDDIAVDAPVMANRVLACIRKIYNWGIDKDQVEVNPCARMSRPGGAERERDRVLSDSEIKAVWKAFEEEESSVADTFKLRLITAQRGGEVLSMRWAEIDLKERWWTIPKERSKNKLAHRVWISEPALRILERLQESNKKRTKRSGGPSPWVFPGKRRGKHLVETKSVTETLRTASGISNWSGHDLRRTAATKMTGDLKVPRFTLSRILNHAEGKGATKVYDRSSYDDEKKDALEKWAKRLMVIVSDLKAVSSAGGPDSAGA